MEAVPNAMAGSGYHDYFKVLGVDRNADADAIKRAFRRLARQYHPDVNPGDRAAEAKFKEVSEAYEVLSDSEKRRRYEQFGQYWNQASGSAGNASGTGFEVDFSRYGNFDDFINDLLGRFGGTQSKTAGFPGGFSRGATHTPVSLDAEAPIHINLGEAFRGTERTLSVNEERVQVRIPSGVRTGSRLRLKGKGNLQPGTGRRGDLYLNLEVQTHPVWTLDGDQLRANLPVAIDELALGATVMVMTPDGEAEVTIPAGTMPGRSLRLKGKGWPCKSGRGDLLLTLAVQFPSHWTSEEAQLLKKLRRSRVTDPRVDWLSTARL